MLVCIKQLFLFYSAQVVPAAFYSSLGESVDDCGGGYSESIAEMCEELHNGSLPLLILTPNGREEAGTNRDCFILNPFVSIIFFPLHLIRIQIATIIIAILTENMAPTHPE